jgi:hypothetical protein
MPALAMATSRAGSCIDSKPPGVKRTFIARELKWNRKKP